MGGTEAEVTMASQIDNFDRIKKLEIIYLYEILKEKSKRDNIITKDSRDNRNNFRPVPRQSRK